MLHYPNIDPMAISIGPFAVHWYGITYLVGFAAGWYMAGVHANRMNLPFTKDDRADLLFYCALGVILGGRIGSVIFYNFSAFAQDPLMLFRIWQGGMSFHGGFIGVLVAMGIFARKRGYKFFQVSDLVAPVTALGLGPGRIGNFINGELWGRVTEVPWGMVFPFTNAGDLPRHPSQLYQFMLEGVVLFLICWIYASKPRPIMAVSGVFVLSYGVLRFFVEFFREPDSHLGFVAFNWMTRGQQLCVPMIIAGAVMVWLAYKRGDKTPTTASTETQTKTHTNTQTKTQTKTKA